MGIKQEVGVTIRTMRKSRRMTQEDLAKAISQSPSSITMYETGRRMPDFETLEALADVFNVPLTALLPAAVGNEPLTLEARLLSRGVDAMPKEQREQALNIFRAVFAQYADYFKMEDEEHDT